MLRETPRKSDVSGQKRCPSQRLQAATCSSPAQVNSLMSCLDPAGRVIQDDPIQLYTARDQG